MNHSNLNLLLHEFRVNNAEFGKCLYPVVVVDCMIAHYEGRGFKFEDQAEVPTSL